MLAVFAVGNLVVCVKLGLAEVRPYPEHFNFGNFGSLGNFGNGLAEASLQLLELRASGTELLVRQLRERCRHRVVLLVQVARIG